MRISSARRWARRRTCPRRPSAPRSRAWSSGLAHTSHGGDILFIEATVLPGGEGVRLRLTGQLGEVMRESAEAALSWVRANADALGLPAAPLAAAEIHLHVPAGAVPKDGPSAGIALATALVSALSGRRARGSVAMTGEISLRGRLLPVGGIKGKVLAAARAGHPDRRAAAPQREGPRRRRPGDPREARDPPRRHDRRSPRDRARTSGLTLRRCRGARCTAARASASHFHTGCKVAVL